MLSGAVVFVLLQPVKLEYRDVVLRENSQSISVVDKIDQFAEVFYEYWFLDSTDNKIVESVTTRTSLLLQTAHVIDWTPAVVPYRNGETFQYMFVTLVPRVIWPNKPVAQQANIDYAIDYGVTSVEGTKRSMFGVGHLGEVFMNFGPLGILPMYILIGILSFLPVYMIRIPKIAPLTQNILRNDLPVAPLALLIAVLFKFIFIGSSVSDTYGGIIQLIVVQGFMLYLFAKQKQSRSLQ